ncbi:MAG: 3-methylcrotonyl-CoA carboxylase, partial [Alphaproteobacteria bacterium]|nr:3-methylcrotonyl-CoA carboxylase [Alphaproteobacteria bacterium]
DRIAALAYAARAGAPSPWARTDGWRLNAPPDVAHSFAQGEAVHRVIATATADGVDLAIAGRRVAARLVARAGGDVVAVLDGTRISAAATAIADAVVVEIAGRSIRLRRLDRLAAAAAAVIAGHGRLVAEVPGVVTAVLVAPGTRVARGDALLVLEAMKVEHTIRAPADGTVEAVRFAVGDQVSEGVELVAFTPAATPAT